MCATLQPSCGYSTKITERMLDFKLVEIAKLQQTWTLGTQQKPTALPHARRHHQLFHNGWSISHWWQPCWHYDSLRKHWNYSHIRHRSWGPSVITRGSSRSYTITSIARKTWLTRTWIVWCPMCDRIINSSLGGPRQFQSIQCTSITTTWQLPVQEPEVRHWRFTNDDHFPSRWSWRSVGISNRNCRKSNCLVTRTSALSATRHMLHWPVLETLASLEELQKPITVELSGV